MGREEARVALWVFPEAIPARHPHLHGGQDRGVARTPARRLGQRAHDGGKRKVLKNISNFVSLELVTNLLQSLHNCGEFSRLKVPTCTFTFKTYGRGPLHDCETLPKVRLQL